MRSLWSGLALAFLALREERWSVGWLQAPARARADSPAGQLLAIFDVFTEWFAREDFEGCAFVTSLLVRGRHALKDSDVTSGTGQDEVNPQGGRRQGHQWGDRAEPERG